LFTVPFQQVCVSQTLLHQTSERSIAAVHQQKALIRVDRGGQVVGLCLRVAQMKHRQRGGRRPRILLDYFSILRHGLFQEIVGIFGVTGGTGHQQAGGFTVKVLRLLSSFPVHPQHTADRHDRQGQYGKADQQGAPIFLQSMQLVLQSAEQMGFVDLKRFGRDFDAVCHRDMDGGQLFPQTVLTPYTKEVLSLSMQRSPNSS
jgi:hypothetical protein